MNAFSHTMVRAFLRTLLGALLGSFISVYCVGAFAQSSSQSYNPATPKTRAEVNADLAEWLAAGYDPRAWWDYPDNALRAGAIVAARRAHAKSVAQP
jgi:hypothetical protein